MTISVIQVQDAAGPTQDDNYGEGEKWSDSGYIYKAESTGLAVLGIRYETERDREVNQRNFQDSWPEQLKESYHPGWYELWVEQIACWWGKQELFGTC